MSKQDDEETTSARAKAPRAPVLPKGAPAKPPAPARGRTDTRRGVDPNLVKTKLTAIRPDGDDDGLMDDGPTMYDPTVPTGNRESTDPIEPSARLDEERRTAKRAATAPPNFEEEEVVRAPTATVIGKRNAKSGPRNAPVQPEPPPAPMPPRFDPHARIDDSRRTGKWDPEQAAHARAPASPAQGLPLQPGPASEPMRAVSMKTPAELEADKPAERPAPKPLPEVRLRAMSDVHKTPPRGVGMGNLAPPFDPKEARSRHRRDNVIWGLVAVIVAAVVMLAVWFLAR